MLKRRFWLDKRDSDSDSDSEADNSSDDASVSEKGSDDGGASQASAQSMEETQPPESDSNSTESSEQDDQPYSDEELELLKKDWMDLGKEMHMRGALCCLFCNSNLLSHKQLNDHIKGKKHLRNLKAKGYEGRALYSIELLRRSNSKTQEGETTDDYLARLDKAIEEAKKSGKYKRPPQTEPGSGDASKHAQQKQMRSNPIKPGKTPRNSKLEKKPDSGPARKKPKWKNKKQKVINQDQKE